MKFLNLPFKSGLLLIICFSLNLSQSNVQTKELSDQTAFDLEEQAKELSRQWNGDSIRHSIVLYSNAAKYWRELKKPQNSSHCLREIARQELLLGNNQESLLRLKESLKIEDEYGNPVGKAKTLSLLSIVLLKLGKLKESKVYWEQSFNEGLKTSNFAAQAMSLYSMAEYYYAQRDFNKAIGFYQKSINFWEQTDNTHDLAQTLIDFGYVYMTIGEPLIGLKKIKAAEILFQQTDYKRGLAIARIAIGHLHSAMDEKQLALESYKKAESDFPEDIDFLEKARLYNGIGLIYEDYGQWNLSHSYRKKALDLFQKENYLYGQIATLPSLIKLSYLTKDENSASKYLSDTQKLSAKLGENFFLSIALRHVGDFYFENGSDTTALEFYQRSLANSQNSGIKGYVALIQNKLGIIYQRKKQFNLTRKYYDSALKISREVSSKFTEAETLYNLAKLDALEGKNETAIKLANESVELTENLYSDIFNLTLKSTYFSNAFNRYELYINLLMKMHRQNPNENYAVQALRSAEKARARSMLENLSLSEAEFTKDADPETVKQEKEIRILINIKADKLTDLLSQNADKNETDKISNEIKELEHELEEIKANLKQSSPIYSAIKNPAPFDVGEFQKQILDENSLLLEFSFGNEESYLWLIGKTEVNSYVLPPREQIEAKIQKLRELLASRERRNDEEIEAFQARIVKADNDYWQIAGQLSSELFGQVSDKFGKNRLIIVPDGKLNYFPVSALPLPNSENNEPILLSNEVIYEPSASTLSILSKSLNQSVIASKNLLVFSDPVFSKEDSRMSTENKAEENLKAESASLESFRFVESLNSLARLTASKDEADSIIDILGTSKADNYSGYSATREQLLNAKTDDYKIIHFATHGLINEERPELSGIVLSRFNENRQKLDEFVRLQDIYGLNLNSDLVVLSACETGIGKEVRGEGLMSLNNAFLQVGAKSVMSSLWKVEDNATLELMKNFYASMAKEKLTPSKALQQAQIKMWQSGRYKSPFYWAAFTVQGDYKRTPNLSRDFSYTIIFSVIGAVVLVFGIFWVYRFRRGKA